MSIDTLPQTTERAGLPALSFTQEQIKLIRDTVAQGTDDNEFALFLYTCKHTGLNPLLRQIHAVKRWDAKLQREAMAIQTGIDGYRLIGERTKKYAPGREATFTYGDDNKLLAATAYVKKLTEDGTWHEVCETAYYAEYVQTKKDGTPNAMWAKMPHSQLAKCAEAKALRRAFPNDTAGIYTDEEMEQADSIITTSTREPIKPPEAVKPTEPAPDGDGMKYISEAQRKRFYAKWKGAGKFEDEVRAKLKETIGVDDSALIPVGKVYDDLCAWAEAKA